ncbi:unnamed protein product [Nesidiocoris tenuis]|uniref:DNA-directed RNA polymerase III subunit RPC3 n=1 Tax=Nesidiocoris tenuis TaxID=355587 RepID=A0A6H5GK28_9HEMI|nr:unnamed protein product [Nesidiocoris tenuis]
MDDYNGLLLKNKPKSDSSQEEFLLWLNIFYYLKTSCCSYGFLGTYITEGADRVASTFLKLPPVSRLFSYLTIINEKYGAPSKLIVETILKNGNSTASKTIVSVWKQLQTGILENYKDGVTGVRDAFRVLVNKQYLSALKIPAQDEKNERVPQISQDESEIARMPEIDASILNKMEAGEPVAAPDADIYWKCNVDRFHQDMRDSIMVEAIRSRIDGHAAFFMEVLLKKMYLRTEGWATQSNPVPILEIKEETEHRNPHLTQYLDQYIKIMEWITPPERTLLSTVEVMIEKLRLAELYMEETILVLNLYSFYASASMKEKLKKREK